MYPIFKYKDIRTFVDNKFKLQKFLRLFLISLSFYNEKMKGPNIFTVRIWDLSIKLGKSRIFRNFFTTPIKYIDQHYFQLRLIMSF